ncbi:MAG: response regulator transcription factor [Tissierellales bacterium]|jgi:DNA-binding response OmpR family regulator|nr:response regulator transcription factor [Tissierellales bacterium]
MIEDESRLRKLVYDYLKKENFTLIEAEDGEIGLELFYENNIDLILLDVMLPKLDGWTVCREIRNTSRVPIIMLTARGEEIDQLFGFELGVDDYLTKPFSPKILIARIHALLKRYNKENTKLEFGNIIIDSNAHEVSLDGLILDLSPKEYDLLLYFTQNLNIALSREQILNHVWGYDYFGDERTVDTHIKRLRLKLASESDYIKTIRGVGYKFEVIS